MLLCSTRYTITTRSWRQLRRYLRPLALRIGVTNGAEFPSPLSSVRRSSAVASACADSCGTTPSVAFWAGSFIRSGYRISPRFGLASRVQDHCRDVFMIRVTKTQERSRTVVTIHR
jgi:hypothetical protein